MLAPRLGGIETAHAENTSVSTSGWLQALGLVCIDQPHALHADDARRCPKAKFIVTDNALTPAETRGGFDAFRWAVYPLKRIGHPKRGGLGTGVVHASKV